MKLRVFSVPGGRLLLPACVLAFLTVGCAPDESPMPNGAYVPETKNVSPAPVPAEKGMKDAAVPAGKPAGEPELDVSEFDLSIPDVHESPAVIPDKAAPSVTAAPAASAKTGTAYKIRKGDSLSVIAKRNGMTARALADYNGIALNKTLLIGSTIYIPMYAGAPKQDTAVKAAPAVLPKKTAKAVPADCVEYVVQPGDSLSRIAYRHSMKMSKLMEMNGLNEKSKLLIGQKLLLPKDAKLRTPAPAAKKTAVSAAESKKKAATVKVSVSTAAAASAPVVKAPEDKESSVDDILNSIGSGDQKPAKAVPVKDEAKSASPVVSAPAPAAPEAVDDATVITLPLDHEMTLEEVARTYEKDIQSLKLLNPGFAEGQKLKAGTVVRMSMF